MLDHLAESHSRFAWTCDFLDNRDADDFHAIPMEDVSILQHLWLSEGKTIRTMCAPLALQSYIDGLPALGPGQPSGSNRPKKTDKSPAWFDDFVKQPAPKHHQPLLPLQEDADAEMTHDADGNESVAGEDAEVEALFNQLDARRTEFREREHTSAELEFRVGLRTSKNSLDSEGIHAQECFGSARTQAACSFCVAHRINQSASFTLSLYGEAQASVLARGWCNRMQWAFTISCDQPNPVVYDLSKYKEPLEFKALSDATTHSNTKARIAKIRALFMPQ